MARRALFITAAGTGDGKTFVGRGLAAALHRRGMRVAAIKPIETDCDPTPLDATALARACDRPELVHADGLYRERAALSPRAITLATDRPPPDPAALARCVRTLAAGTDALLVEGAGGLYAPIARALTIADFARELALPLLLVAPNRLGVLSYVLSLVECAHRCELAIAAVVLVTHPEPDASATHNAAILRESVPIPVLAFAHTPDDDDALASAAEASGLVDLVLSTRTPPDP